MTTRGPSASNARKSIGLVAVATMCWSVVVAAPSAAGAEPDDVTEGLVHHFKLDETSGTTLTNSGSAGPAKNATLRNADHAELTGDGVRFNPGEYADALEGGYVELPDDLTADMTNFTVDYDVWIDPANVGNHQLWSIGSRAGSCDTSSTGSTIFASNTQRFRVAAGSTNVQQQRVRLPEGVWKHVSYVQTANAGGTSWTGTLYIDGVRHAQAANISTPPFISESAGTNCNFLARSQAPGDYSFRGTISDFRVYDRSLDDGELAARAAAANAAGVEDDAAAIDLGLTSAIVDDLELPKLGTVAGSTISWSSSDPAVVEVVEPPAVNSARKVPIRGVITRPEQGEPDLQAVLTATLTKGADAQTVRNIPITVKAVFDDLHSVERDARELEIYAADDVRGHINLPGDGEFGSTISWESTSERISPTGVVSRPAYGTPAEEAVLTATLSKGDAVVTKDFEVVIKPLPRQEEYERYFLGYFKGEGIADGEQIMFATSNGNNALEWTGLTGGRPSLISQLGDQGLRDPHIVRSPDGDTFYMIATDLNWYDQGGYAINDTQYIEVFESNNLVDWTPQRHVKVAPDDAGNAFAPESLWVEETGEYAVFWAQSLWRDPINRTGQGNAQMWYNTTRDFQTFSEPKVWQDPAPLSRIDTTAIKVGDYYYRVTKNEAGNQGSDIFSERHTDFLDSNIDNWELIAPALGRTTWQANAGYEGPVVFEANPGDTACPGQFYLWGDRYTNGGGYQAACHEDIEATTWNAKTITMTNAGVPRPRHGTVLPITLREWNSIRGIENSDVDTSVEISVDSEPGSPVSATARVDAADGFETGGPVRFEIGDWSETVYLADGAATVELPSDLPSGDHALTAEYLGFEFLEASQATASVAIDSTPPASVTADVRCVAGKGVVVVRVTNEADGPLAASIETPFGRKEVPSIAPGRTTAHAFSSRLVDLPSGSVDVAVSDTDGAEATYSADHAPLACGR